MNDSNFKRGIKHFENKDYHVAQILFEKFNKAEPQNVIGIKYLLKIYTELLEKNPTNRVLLIKIEKFLRKYRSEGFIPDEFFLFLKIIKTIFRLSIMILIMLILKNYLP